MKRNRGTGGAVKGLREQTMGKYHQAAGKFLSKKRMSGKRRWRRSKKAEREFERLKGERAEHEAKARTESEERQERIKVLWQEIQSGDLVNETNKDLAENELVRCLVGLVEKQKCEIEYLTQFRRAWERIDAHYPDQLENLSSMVTRTEIGKMLPFFENQLPRQNPRTKWEEDKRSAYRLSGGVGLIEYQFGGAGEAYWRKHSLGGGLGEAYQPTCLDKIFAGGRLKMHEREGEMMSFWSPGHRIREPGLQNLFGMHRNRFPKNLQPKKDGRERWYNYRAVVEIMRALLLENSGRAKGSARLWLRGDPVLRTRVLSGIAARIESLSVSGAVARAFLDVVRQYLPDSAKK